MTQLDAYLDKRRAKLIQVIELFEGIEGIMSPYNDQFFDELETLMAEYANILKEKGE